MFDEPHYLSRQIKTYIILSCNKFCYSLSNLEVQYDQADLPIRCHFVPATNILSFLPQQTGFEFRKSDTMKAHLISFWSWRSLCPLHKNKDAVEKINSVCRLAVEISNDCTETEENNWKFENIMLTWKSSCLGIDNIAVSLHTRFLWEIGE